jgi:hypothetical protein
MTELKNNDYVKILEFYNLSIPKLQNLIKKKAEKILAEKLCRCIKKITIKKNESIAIGICTKSIINKKGFTRSKFKCKNKEFIHIKKNKTRKLKKKYSL